MLAEQSQMVRDDASQYFENLDLRTSSLHLINLGLGKVQVDRKEQGGREALRVGPEENF